MRLSIREEKWIASLGAAETKGEKKKKEYHKYRASIYVRMSRESPPTVYTTDTTVERGAMSVS